GAAVVPDGLDREVLVMPFAADVLVDDLQRVARDGEGMAVAAVVGAADPGRALVDLHADIGLPRLVAPKGRLTDYTRETGHIHHARRDREVAAPVAALVIDREV